MKFYLFAFIYLFIFFGSLYGLFANELNIGFGSNSLLNYSLTGWKKNVFCVLGLILVAAVSTYPVLLGLYKAIKNSGNN